ncbi:unnamed protein product [Calypogeia fissa]
MVPGPAMRHPPVPTVPGGLLQTVEALPGTPSLFLRNRGPTGACALRHPTIPTFNPGGGPVGQEGFHERETERGKEGKVGRQKDRKERKGKERGGGGLVHSLLGTGKEGRAEKQPPSNDHDDESVVDGLCYIGNRRHSEKLWWSVAGPTVLVVVMGQRSPASAWWIFPSRQNNTSEMMVVDVTVRLRKKEHVCEDAGGGDCELVCPSIEQRVPVAPLRIIFVERLVLLADWKVARCSGIGVLWKTCSDENSGTGCPCLFREVYTELLERGIRTSRRGSRSSLLVSGSRARGEEHLAGGVGRVGR